MNYQKIAELEVKGRRIVIKDAMIMLGEDESLPEWPYVNVESGLYTIAICVPEEDMCTGVSVFMAGKTASRGDQIGTVDVDHASIGIIDYDSFLATVQANYEDYEEWTAGDLDDVVWEALSGIMTFENEPLIYVRSGDGDGSYPVYQLEENGQVVGLECVFNINS